ncbi:MAG: DNA polymerase II large subunit [Candidatus Pacearchaeota archaeon]
MQTEQYFKIIEREIKRNYELAGLVRSKGFDPVNFVEVPLAHNLAEKVVGLISTLYPQINGTNIVKRIIELEKEYGKLDPAVCLKIAEEVAKEKFCKFESHLQAIEAGVRIGFAYTTLGVVSSPIEGFTFLKLNKTKDMKDYFAPYFSGPIRSAGTTASCVVLIIIDYLREIFGYAKYDPNEEEIKRTVTELYDFHERVSNLQYLPTEEEASFLARNIPIQISGEPSETIEVSNYKDLNRVETNFLRSGFCLILGEGLAQKAPKALRILKKLREKGFKLSDWDFLEEYCKIHEKRKSGTKDTVATYMNDLVAGRPIFGHPSKSGGFRFRYGRSRVSGFSAASIHPATMAITDNFIAIGTQLKIEKPTKGCVITVCDSIDGPIVKLKDGSVQKINNYEEAKNLYKDVEEVIYLGDILFPLGDVINRNHELIKPGYVEEWWDLQLKKICQNEEDPYNISFERAIEISENYKIPLHPEYIFYWSQISYEQFLELLRWLSCSKISGSKIILPYTSLNKEEFSISKRALELLGVVHKISIENVIIPKIYSRALFANLGIGISLLDNECFIEEEINNLVDKLKKYEERNVLEVINHISEFEIKDKAGDFIGARMGRPEKAKLRKLTGSPHVLFSVGEEGGRFRSVNEASNLGSVNSDFPIFFCEKCGKETIFRNCNICGGETRKMNYCPICSDKFFSDKCPKHNVGVGSYKHKIDIRENLDSATKKLNLKKGEVPALIKGVRGTSSKDHLMEPLEKGILRAMFNINVNKDGTIRYDMTELPITHFKPKEIFVSIDKLRELGYTHDIHNNYLTNDNQVLELMPHDIIIPCSLESGDEKADDVFMNVANFLDMLLDRFYNLPRFYNIKKREDLIGQISVCMAPHNCAGVISRIIGFSKTQGLLASPYMHAAMRRDCFDYNTYVPIKENKSWKIKKIGEVIEELKPQKIIDSCGTKEIKVNNFKTLGLDRDISEINVSNFTKHTKLPIYEIKTALGKTISVTDNHKFKINNSWKRASDLNLGDKIPLIYKINIDSNNLKEINLLEKLKCENLMIRGIKRIIKNIKKEDLNIILKKLNITKKQFQNFNIRDSYPIKFVLHLNKSIKNKIYNIGRISAKRDSVSVPIKIKLDKDILEVIGLYIAEGYSRTISGKKGLNQVYIASCDKEIREFIKKAIKKHFGLVPSENKNDRVTFSSKIIYLFFNKILESGSDAKNKRIPYLFLDLPLDKLACVLRGYFEGDGSAEKDRKKISCDSISEGLLQDLEFCLARFGIFTKRYEYEKQPGPAIREFYLRKNRDIPMFRITKLIIGSDFVNKFLRIGFLSKSKQNILKGYKKIKQYGMRIDYDDSFVYDQITSIDRIEDKESYCLSVDNPNHLVVGNGIVSHNCDGDEAAMMLLLDVLINFSRNYLPSHRGGTQDAPLVLNGRIEAGEVDDQILDFEVVSKYPLELYEKAEKKLHSSEVSIEMIKKRINQGTDPFTNIGYTHETDDFNLGVLCSSYKKLPTMQEKVGKEMELVKKLRAVDAADVARLVIERHFIRDIRGNLRKFSMQKFRCVKCNTKYRRPPLSGNCLHCGGKIIFTISEGGIVKYLEPALNLANNYNIPVYVKQNIELTKKYIESIFGREETKQTALEEWF